MTEVLPVLLFRFVQGSITGDDGQMVLLRGEAQDGQKLLLLLATLTSER